MEKLVNEVKALAAELGDKLSLIVDPDNESVELLHQLCDHRPYYVAVVNLIRVQPVFFCNKGKEPLGIQKLEGFPGMSFYTRFLSPENLPVVKDGISHFVTDPTAPFTMSYRVRTESLGWRWFYGVSIPFGDTSSGVKYTLTILRDVEESFEKLLADTSKGQIGLLASFKARRLLQLSQREKQVLLLMAEDITTQQMAEELHISSDTVQFHRKQLKRKLKVKTSQGLVRYALHLQEFLSGQ